MSEQAAQPASEARPAPRAAKSEQPAKRALASDGGIGSAAPAAPPTPVAKALAEMLAAKDFARLAADLERPGKDGATRRVEVRGDGVVLVWATGAAGDAPPASEVGLWQGAPAPDTLEALVRALAAARPDLLARPTKPEEAILRAQVDRQSALVAVPAPALAALAAAFEAAASAAKPVATLSIGLSLAPDKAGLKGELLLRAGGTESIAVVHPAAAVRWRAVALVRGAVSVELSLADGPTEVILVPGKELLVPFSAPKPEGQGPVQLRWTARFPTPYSRVAGRRAIGGTLLSNAVSE